MKLSKQITILLTLVLACVSSLGQVRVCGTPGSTDVQGKARCSFDEQLDACACTDSITWEPVKPGVDYEIRRCALSFQTLGVANILAGKDPKTVRARGCKIVGRPTSPAAGEAVWSLWDDFFPANAGTVYRYEVRVEGSDPDWKLAPVSLHRAWPRMCVDTNTGEFAPCPELRP